MTDDISAPLASAASAAIAAHQRGDLARAEALYRELLERNGRLPDIEHMLGLLLHQLGRSSESLAWFERAAAKPSPLLWSNHAAALLALGRGEDAERLARQVVTAQPGPGGGWLNLGLALELQRRYLDAGVALTSAVERLPAPAAAARRALARCLLRSGRAGEVLPCLAPLDPSDAAAVLLRAEAHLAQGDAAEAVRLLHAAPSPGGHESAQRYFLLAEAARLQRDSARALALLERATTQDPEHREAQLRSALMQLHRGDVEPALRRFEAWLARHPDDKDAADAYLSGCHYSPRFDAAALHEAHRAHAPRPPVAVSPTLTRKTVASAARRLRIGWLSPRFCHSPVATFFLEPFRRMRERGTFDHVLYSEGRIAAEESRPFRDVAPTWRETADLGDAPLAERISADGIDILVDLAGRSPRNRLPLFARRVAPVQVTWLEYFSTTGVDAMDFLIADPWLCPPGSDHAYSEQVLRLPYGRLCYTPPLPAPPRRRGGNRLVSLNRFSKLNDAVVALWSQVLAALPDWSLHLKGEGGDDPDVTQALRQRFSAHGIAPDRLEFSGYSDIASAMEAYADAAIALDPFPFSGCITTYDALWAGLPIVTLPGDTFASRQTGALLEALGRPDWIARTAEDYVRIVCELAASPQARAAWEREAPARVQRTLCDVATFVPQFEDALLEAWRRRMG